MKDIKYISLFLYKMINEELAYNIRVNIESAKWSNIAQDESEEAIALIREYLSDAALHDKVMTNSIWYFVMLNKHPDAIQLCCENVDKINWWRISYYFEKHMYRICMENTDRIDWWALSKYVIDGNSGQAEANQLINDYCKTKNYLYCDCANTQNCNIGNIDDIKRGEVDYIGLARNNCAKSIMLVGRYMSDIIGDSIDNGIDDTKKKRLWKVLSANSCPDAVRLCRELGGDANRINWEYMSSNSCPDAVQLCRELGVGANRINWEAMSGNKCPDAVRLCRENMDRVDWWAMSLNSCPDAVRLCRENMSRVDWKAMPWNRCPDAMQLCRENMNLVNWRAMASNNCPGAVQVIRDFIAERPENY